MTNGFVFGKIVTDDDGRPVDLVYLEMNQAYERVIGAKREKVLGRRATEACPIFKNDLSDWLAPYPPRAAFCEESSTFERHWPVTGRWYNVIIYSPRKGYFVSIVEDITERRKAEEALKEANERLEEKVLERTRELSESEAKYRSLFDSIDEGFCIIEVMFDESDKPVDYRFLETNAGFERQTGIHDGVGRRMREIEPRHEEQWFEIYGSIAMTGESRRFTQEAKPLMGGWYDVYAFKIGGKESRKVAIIFSDITERKQMEEALKRANESLELKVRERTSELRESEQRLSTHVENSPMAVVEWDADFIVTRWAGEAEEMFGWAAEETVGKPIMDLDLVYPEDAPIVEATMAKLTDGVSKRVVSSNRNVTKYGRILYCKWYNTVIYDERGKMVSVLSFVLDNTARVKAEDALKESGERFERLPTTVPQLMWMTDTTGWIFWYNKQWFDYTGTTLDEMKGWGWQKVHHPIMSIR